MSFLAADVSKPVTERLRRDLTLAQARITAAEGLAFALLQTLPQVIKSPLLEALRQVVVQLGTLPLPSDVAANQEKYYRNSLSQKNAGNYRIGGARRIATIELRHCLQNI